MKGLFKEFMTLCEIAPPPMQAGGGAGGALQPSTQNKVSDPRDRQKRQLATQAQTQLTKAKAVIEKPNANPQEKKAAVKELQATRDQLRHVAAQDAVGDIENQLKQITPATQIGASATAMKKH